MGDHTEHVAFFLDADPQMSTRFTKAGGPATKMDIAIRGLTLLRHIKGQWRHHLFSVNSWSDAGTLLQPLGAAPRTPAPPTVRIASAPCGPLDVARLLMYTYGLMGSTGTNAKWRIVIAHGRTRSPPLLTPDTEEVLRGSGIPVDSVYLHTHAEAAEGPAAASTFAAYQRMADMTGGYALRACSDDVVVMRCFTVLAANSRTRPLQEHYRSSALDAAGDSVDGSTAPMPSLRQTPMTFRQREDHAEVLEVVPEDRLAKAVRTPLPVTPPPEGVSPNRSPPPPPVAPGIIIAVLSGNPPSPRPRSQAVIVVADETAAPDAVENTSDLLVFSASPVASGPREEASENPPKGELPDDFFADRDPLPVPTHPAEPDDDNDGGNGSPKPIVILPGDGGLDELGDHSQRASLAAAYHARDALQRHRWGTETVSDNGDTPGAVFVATGFVVSEGTRTHFHAFDAFRAAVTAVVGHAQNGPCRTATRRRLHILEQKFDLFKMLNAEVENKLVQDRGPPWEETLRVNIGVRAERCMPKTDLIRTLTAAAEKGDDPELMALWADADLRVVSPETLGIVFDPAPSVLSANLDVFGLQRLRRPKRSSDVLRHALQYTSPYLPAMVSATLKLTPASSVMDLCLTLTGGDPGEWRDVAAFAVQLIRVRPAVVFTVRIAVGRVPVGAASFEAVLLNIFRPFWDPFLSADMGPVLDRIVAFLVYSPSEAAVALRPPSEYLPGDDVAPLVAMYYVWCNVQILNSRRPAPCPHRQFRFSCSAATDVWLLAAAYLLCDVVCNAVPLVAHPVLHYLCYLHDVGIVVSVLGRIPGADAAMEHFLKCGSPVALGTEDPLQRYNHNDALLEEYTAARRDGRLTSMDVYEMCYRSLTIGVADPQHTKELLPGLLVGRIAFRQMCLGHEHLIARGIGASDVLAVPERPNSNRERGVNFVRIRTYNSGTVNSGRPVVARDPGASDGGMIAVAMLSEALAMRRKYSLGLAVASSGDSQRGVHGLGGELPSQGPLRCDNGVWTCSSVLTQPPLDEYMRDYTRIGEIAAHPVVQHLADRRLRVLLSKFELHVALNQSSENAGETQHDHRDLYHTVKVDTHCHLAAGMTAKELLSFMKDQFLHHGDDVVWSDNVTTLSQLQARLKIVDVEALTVDSLDVQADNSVWDRFDNFNSKYNPLGFSALREIFLKTDNAIKGRYFAEITKQVFRKSLLDGYVYTEFRVSIYGRHRSEWSRLASWFATHGMASRSNKFMVQIPRIYHVYRKARELHRFADLLDNIFVPLWEVSISPAADPALHNFLQHMSGFDSVDNEAALDYSMGESANMVTIRPADWASERNPPYWYWMYYLWANIRSLNAFRASRGLTTFSFRPHCGESGSPSHLIDGFLVASGVNHAVSLRHSPVLQYLYFLAQIGIAMSPLSNNSMFLTYMKNPFPMMFKRGLNVTLSTDDPLQFHHTSEPLIEEYSIASKMWKLSATDLCEIARYSVLQSGFDADRKAAWLGPRYTLSSSQGNLPDKSHVPNIRVAFRFETYHDECNYLDAVGRGPTGGVGAQGITRAMYTVSEETAMTAAARAPSKL